MFSLVEITPSMGAGLRADLDPPTGLVTPPKPIATLNLSVGVVF